MSITDAVVAVIVALLLAATTVLVITKVTEANTSRKQAHYDFCAKVQLRSQECVVQDQEGK